MPMFVEILEIILVCIYPNMYGRLVTKFSYIHDSTISVQGILIFIVYIYQKSVLRVIKRNFNNTKKSGECCKDEEKRRMHNVFRA